MHVKFNIIAGLAGVLDAYRRCRCKCSQEICAWAAVYACLVCCSRYLIPVYVGASHCWPLYVCWEGHLVSWSALPSECPYV